MTYPEKGILIYKIRRIIFTLNELKEDLEGKQEALETAKRILRNLEGEKNDNNIHISE